MPRLDRFQYILLAALMATLPFDLQGVPILSNLQWLFVALAVVSLPVIVRERQRLLKERLVIAAFVFVCVQWISALLAPEFTTNAVKAAIRVTAGFMILCASLCVRNSEGLKRIMAISAVFAALYGIADLLGFGFPHLFRDVNFYYANVTRLSGSFEYPNTAAAFFALALPIVWIAAGPLWFRIAGALIVWSALILTYSRGAAIAALLMLALWAARGRVRMTLPLLVLCSGILVTAVVVYPAVAWRFLGLQSHLAFSVRYEPQFNLLRRSPNESEMFAIKLRNDGTTRWRSIDGKPFWLRYRWFDSVTKTIVLEPNRYTPVPVPVEPDGSVEITAPLRTPSQPGLYILTWDLFGREPGWFSARGIYPSIIEVDVQPGTESWSGQGDVSRWYARETSSVFVTNDPFERLELWKTGLQLFAERPILGVGMDNFRLLQGTRRGIKEWDKNIRANSLYIELLAGSGLAGLAAFCVMMGMVRWRLDAASVALGIFLIHGLVDVFLMTTPVYFAFWFLLGQAGRSITTETQRHKGSAARINDYSN
jgi:hypothetical protein